MLTQLFPPPLRQDPVGGARTLLQWSFITLDAVEEALHFPVKRLAEDLEEDGDYARTMVETYKMLWIDRATAPARQRFADQILNHLAAALRQSGHLPSDDALSEPLDLTRIPTLLRAAPVSEALLRDLAQLLR